MEEINTIIQIAKGNGFLLDTIHCLKNRLKRQSTQPIAPHTYSPNSWVYFTYHGPCIRKVMNLFKNTNLNVTFAHLIQYVAYYELNKRKR
jgi:hypothetical protein